MASYIYTVSYYDKKRMCLKLFLVSLCLVYRNFLLLLYFRKIRRVTLLEPNNISSCDFQYFSENCCFVKATLVTILKISNITSTVYELSIR